MVVERQNVWPLISGQQSCHGVVPADHKVHRTDCKTSTFRGDEVEHLILYSMLQWLGLSVIHRILIMAHSLRYSILQSADPVAFAEWRHTQLAPFDTLHRRYSASETCKGLDDFARELPFSTTNCYSVALQQNALASR